MNKYILLSLLFFSSVFRGYTQTDNSSATIRWQVPMTAWSPLTLNSTYSTASITKIANGVLLYWQKSPTCDKSGNVIGKPKVLVYNSDPGITIQEVWVLVRGTHCDGRVTSELFVIDQLSPYERKSASGRETHDFKEITEIVSCKFSYNIGKAEYSVRYNKDEGINVFTINGMSISEYEDWVKNNQQKEFDRKKNEGAFKNTTNNTNNNYSNGGSSVNNSSTNTTNTSNNYSNGGTTINNSSNYSRSNSNSKSQTDQNQKLIEQLEAKRQKTEETYDAVISGISFIGDIFKSKWRNDLIKLQSNYRAKAFETLKIKLSQKSGELEDCSECGGSGRGNCKTCKGEGSTECGSCSGKGTFLGNTCTGCKGSGSVECSKCYGLKTFNCGKCDGTGKIFVETKMDKIVIEKKSSKVSEIIRRPEEIALLEKGRELEALLFKQVRAEKNYTSLPTGVFYTVVKQGQGLIPTAKDTVVLNVVLLLPDGTEIDNSNKTKESYIAVAGELIRGLKDVLFRLGEGSIFRAIIPAQQAYGEVGTASIPPNSALIYDVAVVSVRPAK